jgi:hypothetical protein
MPIGYARVSTPDQSLNLQRDALKKIGCKRVFTDVAGGAGAERSWANKGSRVCPVRRLARRLEARPLRASAARSGLERQRAEGADGRLPKPARGARHDDERRSLCLPRIRRTCRVRAGSEDLIRERYAGGPQGGARAWEDVRRSAHPHRQAPRARAVAFQRPEELPRDIAKTIGVSLSTLYRYVRPPTVTPAAASTPRAPTTRRASAQKRTQQARHG